MSALSRADALLEAVLRRLDRVIDVSAGEAETNAALRQQARRIYFQAYPRQRGRVQVHHRIPLEWWRRVFRGTDPNRLANLQGLNTQDHRHKASDLWDAFRAAYNRLGRWPTRAEVVQFAGVVDRSLNLPYPLP
jgi:hypothetical protein